MHTDREEPTTVAQKVCPRIIDNVVGLYVIGRTILVEQIRKREFVNSMIEFLLEISI